MLRHFLNRVYRSDQIPEGFISMVSPLGIPMSDSPLRFGGMEAKAVQAWKLLSTR